jgi:hypothetical protein
MHSSLLASVDVIEFQTTEAYSNLDPNDVKYNIYKQSRDENLKVMERIRPNSFKNLLFMRNNNNNRAYRVCSIGYQLRVRVRNIKARSETSNESLV